MIDWIATADGRSLEAVWDTPAEPVRSAVFCHPHPRYGGSMHAPLMVAVTRHLLEAGLAVLRFNFRGVGRSTGSWSGGIEEIDDVAAAYAAARAALPGLEAGLLGWSFGAATALRWQARDRMGVPYVGIAPPVEGGLALPAPAELPAAPRRFIVGDRDQFVPVAALRDYAGSIGADLVVLEGSDHFFAFRAPRLAEAAAAGLSRPAPLPPDPPGAP